MPDGRARCREPSCGAAIVWATNATTGRAIPVDAAPSEGGNIRLDGVTCEVLSGDALADARAAGDVLHLSHFATCTKAANFRKARR